MLTIKMEFCVDISGLSESTITERESMLRKVLTSFLV